MPHLTLEYSSNVTQEVDFQALFLELHQMVAEHGDTLVANCKSRAYRLDDYLVASGEAGAAFVFDGTTGELLHRLFDPGRSPLDTFGSSVAVAPAKSLLLLN